VGIFSQNEEEDPHQTSHETLSTTGFQQDDNAWYCQHQQQLIRLSGIHSRMDQPFHLEEKKRISISFH